jgi:hypothetical protein
MSSSCPSHALFGPTMAAIAWIGAVSGACTGKVDAPRLGRIDRVYAPGPVVLPRLTEARYRDVEARGLAARNVELLDPIIDDDAPLVVVELSE